MNKDDAKELRERVTELEDEVVDLQQQVKEFYIKLTLLEKSLARMGTERDAEIGVRA